MGDDGESRDDVLGLLGIRLEGVTTFQIKNRFAA